VAEARAVAVWIFEMTGRADVDASTLTDANELRDMLLSGEVLCDLANAIVAWGAVADECGAAPPPPAISYQRGAVGKFRCMENVSKFIGACRGVFKVPEHQLFCTNDLSEGRDMQAVVRCILALGGRVQAMYPNYQGPRLLLSAQLKAIAPHVDESQACDCDRPDGLEWSV